MKKASMDLEAIMKVFLMVFVLLLIILLLKSWRSGTESQTESIFKNMLDVAKNFGVYVG